MIGWIKRLFTAPTPSPFIGTEPPWPVPPEPIPSTVTPFAIRPMYDCTQPAPESRNTEPEPAVSHTEVIMPKMPMKPAKKAAPAKKPAKSKKK